MNLASSCHPISVRYRKRRDTAHSSAERHSRPRRPRAVGRSRAEIREIYVAELRARSLKIPPEHILDALVERINGNPLPTAHVLGESLTGMAKAFHEIFLGKVGRRSTTSKPAWSPLQRR